MISLPEFPNSLTTPFQETSKYTTSYNCIAWAYEDPSKWYWPDPKNIYYWPPNVPRKIDIASFIKLFETLGYRICLTGKLEKEYQKIAIFADKDDVPTHAARQLDNGFWTSKLGQDIDVQHTIQSIEDGFYGRAVVCMKKRKPVPHNVP